MTKVKRRHILDMRDRVSSVFRPKPVRKSMSFLRGAPARVEKMGRNIMAKSATLPPAEPEMMMSPCRMVEDEEVDELVAVQAQVRARP